MKYQNILYHGIINVGDLPIPFNIVLNAAVLTVIETVADSLFIKPGTVSKLRINNPNNFPLIDCLVVKRVSFEVRIDSFHETFKNTKVRTIVRTAALSTMLKGIGKSPTFIIP